VFFSALPGCKPESVQDFRDASADVAVGLEATADSVRARNPDSADRLERLAGHLSDVVERIDTAIADGTLSPTDAWDVVEARIEIKPEEKAAIRAAIGLIEGDELTPETVGTIGGALTPLLGPWGPLVVAVGSIAFGWLQRAKRRRTVRTIAVAIDAAGGPVNPAAASAAMAVVPGVSAEVRAARKAAGTHVNHSASSASTASPSPA
jgi:hypothetical protein